MALNLQTGELDNSQSPIPHSIPKSLECAFRTFAPEITSFDYDLRRGVLEFTVDSGAIFLFLNECGIEYSYSRNLAFEDKISPLRVTVQLRSFLSFFYRLIIEKQRSYVAQKSSPSR